MGVTFLKSKGGRRRYEAVICKPHLKEINMENGGIVGDQVH